MCDLPTRACRKWRETFPALIGAQLVKQPVRAGPETSACTVPAVKQCSRRVGGPYRQELEQAAESMAGVVTLFSEAQAGAAGRQDLVAGLNRLAQADPAGTYEAFVASVEVLLLQQGVRPPGVCCLASQSYWATTPHSAALARRRRRLPRGTAWTLRRPA